MFGSLRTVLLIVVAIVTLEHRASGEQLQDSLCLYRCGRRHSLPGSSSTQPAISTARLAPLAPMAGNDFPAEVQLGRGLDADVLYSLTGGADGGSPSGMIFDAAGNLYGTTYTGRLSCGGAQGGGCGGVFKLTPHSNGTWTESVLHTFTQGADGAYPVAGLALNPVAALLFGATMAAGSRALSARER